jgi:hypothetical protein
VPESSAFVVFVTHHIFLLAWHFLPVALPQSVFQEITAHFCQWNDGLAVSF